jgi:hypothetical protein
MSNGRRHRRSLNASKTARRADLTIALVASKLTGCTCQPDLRHRHADGIALVAVGHDAWCPIVDHVSQIVIRRDER